MSTREHVHIICKFFFLLLVEKWHKLVSKVCRSGQIYYSLFWTNLDRYCSSEVS